MDMIKVEVAYATPEKQRIIEVDVPLGTTVAEAVRQSGIEREFPELSLEGMPMELYRPLLIDPKQARLNRAAKAKQDVTGGDT